MIVNLTIAKLKILELKADDYNWQYFVPNKEQLLKTLEDIDKLLIELNKELNT